MGKSKPWSNAPDRFAYMSRVPANFTSLNMASDTSAEVKNEPDRSVSAKLTPDRFARWKKALDKSAFKNCVPGRPAPRRSSLKPAFRSIPVRDSERELIASMTASTSCRNPN